MALAPEQVGKRIADARKAKGYVTHEQFLEAVREHISPQTNLRTVQRWQTGRDPRTGKSWLPRLGTLMELADLLDVPRSYFVEDDAPVPADEAALLRAEIAELRDQSRAREEEILRLLRALGQPPSEQP